MPDMTVWFCYIWYMGEMSRFGACKYVYSDSLAEMNTDTMVAFMLPLAWQPSDMGHQ